MEPTKQKFKKNDLVSFKGGENYKPVLKIVSSWWDITGWWNYSLINGNGIIEKYPVAEHCLELRTDKIATDLFKTVNVKKRKKLVS
jgi:hypothetical protein